MVTSSAPIFEKWEEIKDRKESKKKGSSSKINDKHKIMVVEDDKSLNFLFETALKSLADRVECEWFTSAEDAINSLLRMKMNNEEIDYALIVADIYLEGEVSGLDMWEICMDICPDSPFLIISSRSEKKVKDITKDLPNQPPFLQKPFDIWTLRNTLEDYLED
ncbi:MAG: hypothetical protein ACOCUH_02185 [Bacteriovoracia bacterium]